MLGDEPGRANGEAPLAGMIFFTGNYQDRSTNDGYQFEFFWRAAAAADRPR